MKLIVEEEYGFKYWFWTIEGTQERIEKTFNKAISVPTYYSDRDTLGGTWEEVDWEEWRNCELDGEYDGFAHIHMNDDSKIIWRQQ